MIANQNIQKYNIIARVFHWVMALMMIALVGIGLYMADLKPSPEKWQLYDLHKATGMTVFGLAILRLLWRWISPPPPIVAGLHPFIKWAATNNIRLLYVLLFIYPLSGFLMSYLGGHAVGYFGLFTIEPSVPPYKQFSSIAHFMHVEVIFYLLIASFSAHVLGAIYHHFIRKDETLRKML